MTAPTASPKASRCLVELAAGRPAGPLPDDAEGLVREAHRHGMHGLLASWVREHDPDWPGYDHLERSMLVTRQRHERLTGGLVAVRDRLATIGVEVAAVKGVVAEARWYAATGERPTSDVDVLVDPAAIGRAREIVATLEPDHPLLDSVGDLVASGVLGSVNVIFGDTPVDLHFDLYKTGIPSRSRDLVWEHTTPWSMPDGSTVRAPDPALALVHFLVHVTKDCFWRLLGYADVARVLRDPDLDPTAVDALVAADGLGPVVGGALGRITTTLGVDPVVRIGERGWRTRAWPHAWPESTALLGGAGTARSRRQDLLPFFQDGRGGEAWTHLWRIAFPPAATVAVQYPDIHGPVLVRLARGRWRTARARSRALAARRAGSVDER